MKFRMKPVEVDAEQWFPGKQVQGVEYDQAGNKYQVATQDGARPLNPGDWVVTGAGGEKYTFKPDVFSITFDATNQNSKVMGRGYCLGIILHFLSELKQGVRLGIVETGTLRSVAMPSLIGDGWSTFYVAEWIRRSCPSAFFMSVDASEQAVKTCRELLAREGLDQYVQHWCMHSKELARMTMPVDLAFLDSSDDPQNQLEEFLALERNFRKPAICVLDDIYETQDGGNKGAKLIPHLQKQGLRVERLGRMAVTELGPAGIWEKVVQSIENQRKAGVEINIRG
ncbi:MAG: class I SAM-dependent methyltransferase [Terriglobia bacterium]